MGHAETLPQRRIAGPAVLLPFLECVHEPWIQTMRGNIGADTRLAFGQEAGFAMRGEQTVHHADIVVIKHQPSA